MGTATTVAEALLAVAGGVDCLCLQGVEAGAHRGSFADRIDGEDALPVRDLLAAVAAVADVPLIAAGGVGLPEDVHSLLAAGAIAVQAGTAFLRATESGAHPAYKAALVDPQFTQTTTTRSYSGRLARGLLNRFMREHAVAPVAYPEINNATRPLRAAAAQRSDTSARSLWAGTGYRHARDASVADIVDWLAGGAG
jgi:nitronate monooxygenase